MESDFVRNMSSTDSKRQLSSFKFDDYAPLVFQKMRERFKISEEEYMKSLGPE